MNGDNLRTFLAYTLAGEVITMGFALYATGAPRVLILIYAAILIATLIAYLFATRRDA